ncbi:MAG: type II secretion system major pseudopilin GspG [Phycisphaerales bacterium]|nr:type II secretion system major pseudopilin GspG [Phycisphaerales bacterium]
MLKNRLRTGTRHALTLIELLIVITILLALGALIAVNFLGIGDQAKVDLQKAQLDRIQSALKVYRANMGSYPTEEEGLTVLWDKSSIEDEADASRWAGPYIEEPPKDYWGNEIVYQRPTQLLDTEDESVYDLVCLGPDGEQDTEDDITNHDRKKNEDGDFESGSEFSGPGDIGGR